MVFADTLSKTIGLSACHVRDWTPAVLASVWKLKPPSCVGKLNGQCAIYVLACFSQATVPALQSHWRQFFHPQVGPDQGQKQPPSGLK